MIMMHLSVSSIGNFAETEDNMNYQAKETDSRKEGRIGRAGANLLMLEFVFHLVPHTLIKLPSKSFKFKYELYLHFHLIR